MPDSRPFRIADRLRSFRYAWRGILTLLRTQHNAWIHAGATFTVLVAGFAFHLAANEWLAVILAIVAVWMAEALNTAFEFLADVVSPEFHPQVERAKDVAAGAVLVAAIGAAAIGVVVFGPYLLAWLRG